MTYDILSLCVYVCVCVGVCVQIFACKSKSTVVKTILPQS